MLRLRFVIADFDAQQTVEAVTVAAQRFRKPSGRAHAASCKAFTGVTRPDAEPSMRGDQQAGERPGIERFGAAGIGDVQLAGAGTRRVGELAQRRSSAASTGRLPSRLRR